MPKDAKALALDMLEETWNQETSALIEELCSSGLRSFTHLDGELQGIAGGPNSCMLPTQHPSPICVLRLKIS